MTRGVQEPGEIHRISAPRTVTAKHLSMGQTLPTKQTKDAGIDVVALQDMYKRFITECPSGLLFLHEFKKFFGIDGTGEASEYAENMFRAFDKNGDNTIDFLEFVAALNLVFRGDLGHKLRWSFKVYDKDGNGFLDRAELRTVVEVICHVKKVDNKDSEVSVDKICERIFYVVDVNRDGRITLEEFMEGAKKDPWILNMLHLDMKPYSWVQEQRRKSVHF